MTLLYRNSSRLDTINYALIKPKPRVPVSGSLVNLTISHRYKLLLNLNNLSKNIFAVTANQGKDTSESTAV